MMMLMMMMHNFYVQYEQRRLKCKAQISVLAWTGLSCSVEWALANQLSFGVECWVVEKAGAM